MNTELKSGGIFESYNVLTKAAIELAGDKRAHVYGLRSWTYVGFCILQCPFLKKSATPNKDR